MKHCPKCRQMKSLDQFHNDQARRDGKYPNCKECTRAYMRNHQSQPYMRQRRKEKWLTDRQDQRVLNAAHERSARLYSSVIGRAKTLCANAYSRDPASTVTLEHIINLITVGVCPVTRIPFDLTNDHQRVTGRKKNPYAPSLDRIDSRLGYTDANTRIVIWQYNMMKGELSDIETFLICKAVVDRYK